MGKIIEAGELPLEEKVYLKKDMFGWRVVQPIKNPDGRVNWLNLLFGGVRNALFLLLIIIVLLFLIWSYKHDISTLREVYGNMTANPIAWCHDVCFPKNWTAKLINVSDIQIGG